MVFRFGLLIPYFIIFLSVRECLFPIQLRQWCRNHIGVFPLGLHPDGFPCFKFDLFGLNRYRDHDHESFFSRTRKDFESQIWDPGDSKFKTETGGIRPWISHICGNLFPFVAEIGILVVPDVDVDVMFHLLRIPFGIREISKFKTRDIILRSAGLYQFGFCWIEMSILHLVLIKFLRQVLVGIAQIWRLQNGLAAFRWESIDMRRSGIWDAMVNLFVVMLMSTGRQDPGSSPTTLIPHFLSKVMQNAF